MKIKFLLSCLTMRKLKLYGGVLPLCLITANVWSGDMKPAHANGEVRFMTLRAISDPRAAPVPEEAHLFPQAQAIV